MESVTGQSLRERQESDSEIICDSCGNDCGLYVVRLAGGVNCNRCFKATSFDFAVTDYNNSPHRVSRRKR